MSRARKGSDPAGSAPRIAWAHIPHPTVTGASLCGDVTRLMGCPACVSKLVALLLVHVQSARKPDKSLCGVVLTGADVHPMGSRPADGASVKPSPAYVSIERARDLISARTDAGALDGAIPICPGCESNLDRIDDAHRRRSDRSIGRRSALAVLDVSAASADDEE